MNKKIYFASDFHLGLQSDPSSQQREDYVVHWLNSIIDETQELYLVGDIFDFWFEYKHVIPKGYSKFLSAIKQFRERDIPVYFFTGNHDMWMFDYFEKEYGIPVIRNPIEKSFGEKRFYIGHGDGLGPGDQKYKLLKKVFANKACQWAFGWIHPNLGMAMARYWSKQSRMANNDAEYFLGPDKEWLIQYAEDEISKGNDSDFYIFGHRHLTIDYLLSNGRSRYINLGEWVFNRSYAEFDGKDLTVKFFDNEKGKLFPEK